MPRLLTNKRQQWVQNRNTVIRGEVLRPNIAVEGKYANNLDRLVAGMIDQVRKEVMALFGSRDAVRFYAQDASISSQARIILNKLERDFIKQFKNQGHRYSANMVDGVNQISKSSLSRSLKKLSGGLTIKTDILTGDLKEILTATIEENVGLIKTIPETFLGQVRGEVMRSITQPNNRGLAGVTENLNKLLDTRSKQIKNKARNIATDQTRKLYNNINKGRMEKVGLKKFEWVHSGGGQKPRELHRDVLNGQIFTFDDLPIIDERTGERGIPGQAINCRCTMLPVLEFG